MAPDLNSLPVSPHQNSASQSRQPSVPSSRRSSQIFPMNPPPLPLGSVSTGGQPLSTTGHLPFPPLSPSISSSEPVRHPRPMTAAELHLELEKEQEAVVNRLTRELSALRAHSASVASTTSSTSTTPQNPGAAALDHHADPHGAPHGGLPFTAGPTHPIASRRHRSSSTASMRLAQPARSASTSVTSGAGNSSVVVPTTPRLEDVAFHRHELEEVKRENERLRRRVRELEGLVRGRRENSAIASAEAEVEARGRSGPVANVNGA